MGEVSEEEKKEILYQTNVQLHFCDSVHIYTCMMHVPIEVCR